MKALGTGLLIFIALGALFGIYFGNSGQHRVTPSMNKSATDADLGMTAIYMARKKVPDSMRDPSSAQFRNVSAVKTPAGGYLVCGEVNGKNGFGGNAGFHKFMFNTQLTVLEESMKPAEFVKAWNGSCAKWPVVASSKS